MTSTLPPLVQAFSGAIGSATANALTYPLDLVTTRLQLQPSTSRHPRHGLSAAFHIIHHITKKYGITTLYDGVWTDTGATLLSNFFYFYIYTFLRTLSTRRQLLVLRPSREAGKTIPLAPHKPNVLEELVLGFIAGVASRAISTPLNIITLRLQQGESEDDDDDEFVDRSQTAQDDGKSESPVQDKPRKIRIGIQAVIRPIYNEQGLGGFWRGFKLTTLLSLNPSITLALFQLFRRILAFKTRISLSRNEGLRVANLRPDTTATPPNAKPSEAFLGAAISNSIASTLLYPLILAKTRLQASPAGTSLWNALYINQGTGKARANQMNTSGLYQGLSMQILKGFLSQGVTFLVKGRIEQMIVKIYLERMARRRLMNINPIA